MDNYLENLTATINSGQSLSDSVYVKNLPLVGIVMPGAWDAADVTFQASKDGATFYNLYDVNGVEKKVTAAASRYIVVDPTALAGVQHLKVRSGTSAAPVNQTAQRSVTLVIRTT